MKKIISLMLIVVLCLSLCACGGTTYESGDPSSDATVNNIKVTPYEMEFKNIVDGYIDHYTVAKNDFETDKEGFVSCDDFYVFLPANSVISCEKEFAFFCYDSSYYLDSAIMEESGLTMDYITPAFTTGSFTLSGDCYLRFSVKGSFEDIKISVPEGQKDFVIYGNKEDLRTKSTLRLMKQNLEGRDSAVNYIFMTDLHYDMGPDTPQGAALIRQVETAVAIANSNDSVDFICIGGDITSGMFESKEEYLKYTNEILGPLKKSEKPVFILMGNHDDNSYHRFTYDVYYPDRIMSDNDWNEKILKTYCPSDIKQDSDYKNSKYFYYDLNDKKTRVICLDSVDYRAKFDNKGKITELPIKNSLATTHLDKYWSGCSWWGYSNGQLEWLVNEAMTAGDDWNYVFLSHMGIDYQTNAYNYGVIGGSELRKIISAYQNKKDCKIGTAQADFSKTKGRILAYQFGHQHLELTLKSKDINLWQICTSTAGAGQRASTLISSTSVSDKTLGWKVFDRILGTESEACIDVMSADNKKVYKWNIGGGDDVVMEQ